MPYVSIESGFIAVPSDLTWDNAIDFLGVFKEMEAHARVHEIAVHVTSVGGALLPAVAICQTLRGCKKPVRTIGAGYVASAAVSILAAGSPGKREAYAGTLLMLHEPSSTLLEASKRSPTADQWQKEVDAQRIRINAFYAMLSLCTSQPEGFWKKKIEGQPDQYFSVDEAKALGLIDNALSV